MAICPYIEDYKCDQMQTRNKCVCRLGGLILSSDDLLIQYVCKDANDEYRRCLFYKNAVNTKKE